MLWGVRLTSAFSGIAAPSVSGMNSVSTPPSPARQPNTMKGMNTCSTEHSSTDANPQNSAVAELGPENMFSCTAPRHKTTARQAAEGDPRTECAERTHMVCEQQQRRPTCEKLPTDTCAPIMSRKGAAMEPRREAWVVMPSTEERQDVGSSSAM